LRRHGFRCALIGKRALDDRPIDTSCPALGRRFAFSRRRRRNVFVAAIDHRFEGIELRRRLAIAPIATAAAIAVATFAEGLAAFATPRSAVAIAPLTVARPAFSRLAFATLALRLTIAVLIVASLIVAPCAITTLTIAIAVTSIAWSAPARTTLAALLLLLLLLRGFAGGGRYRLVPRRLCAFGPRATTTTTAAPRPIARWQSRQGELAARSNRFDAYPTRRLLRNGLIAFGRGFSGSWRRFIRCSRRCRIGRSAFRFRPMPASPTPATAVLLRITRKVQRARFVARLGRIRCLWRRRSVVRTSGLARHDGLGRSRLRRGRRLGMWRRRACGRAWIFIIPDHDAET
jgi:hypothetical protein